MVKQKTFHFARKALCGAALRASTCPRKLWKGLWITCVHMATGHAGYGVGTIVCFLYSERVLPVLAWPGMLPADFLFQWLPSRSKQGEHDVQHPVYHRRDVRFW